MSSFYQQVLEVRRGGWKRESGRGGRKKGNGGNREEEKKLQNWDQTTAFSTGKKGENEIKRKRN